MTIEADFKTGYKEKILKKERPTTA